MFSIVMSENMLKNLNYEKIYFWTIAVFALLMPLSRAAISFFAILLPLIWIIEGDFKRKFEFIQKNTSLKFFLAFLFLLVISLFWTENIQDAKRPLRLISYFFTMFVISTSLKPKYTEKIISFFLIGMFISETITYSIYFNLLQINGATPSEPSPFMLHIDYSVFLAFTSILLLHRIFSSKYSWKEKTIYTFFFLTVTGNLFISNGRTGQVALIAGLFVMSVLHFRFTFKALVIGATTFILIFATAFFTIKPFQMRVHQAVSDLQKLKSNNFNSSWGIRTAFYITTLNIAKEHPLIGVGIGDFMHETEYEVKKQKYNYLTTNVKQFLGHNTPHNQYLLILLQTGIIGLSLFILFLYHFTKLPIQNKEIKDTSLLFITVFIVSFMADTLLMQQFTIALFSLFSGLFIANSKISN